MRSRVARKAVCAMRNRCSISSSHSVGKKSARAMCSIFLDLRANKPLHFEVAIIRAIQSLGQATLDEVIENLSALRAGKPVAGGVDAGPAGITDAGYSKSESAQIAESPSNYKAARPSADVDPAQVWEQLSAKIPPQKAFLRNSAAAAH